MNGFVEQLEQDGYYIVRNCLTTDHVQALIVALDQLKNTESSHCRRNLFAHVPLIADLSTSDPMRQLVEPVLGENAIAVKATLFDKSPDSNWGVFWHQDITISVAARREVDGFVNWSTKGGVISVQPPVEVLEQMLAIRIHLDDCDERSGALSVVPGSHSLGRCPDDQINRHVQQSNVETCNATAGSVLVMRPLLIHSSYKTKLTSHRRVIHLEYSAARLPGDLEWNFSIPSPQLQASPR